jgi:hypothetical protein
LKGDAHGLLKDIIKAFAWRHVSKERDTVMIVSNAANMLNAEHKYKSSPHDATSAFSLDAAKSRKIRPI